MAYRLEPGTQIIYLPTHAKGDKDHPDVEHGFVTSHFQTDVVFCRYWSKHHGGLRTTTCSEATPLWAVKVEDTRPQHTVDAALARIQQED